MPDYRLTLAYDGTDFAGWQRQGPDRGRTVQGVLENALALLAGTPVAVVGAGRTDAGVHALGQVASFTLRQERTAGEILAALNGLLPPDLRVLAAAAAPPGFHARRSARSKVYRYELDTGPLRLPIRRRYAGHVRWRLDRAAVERAAALYVGRQDFASLASSGGSVKTTVRTVSRSEVRWEEAPDPAAGPKLVYETEADGFLRKMVRSMVGGLVAAGRGAMSLDDLHGALAARDRRRWPAPVEPCGLTLLRVDYNEGPALT